jgi:hypothetical protein
MIWIIVNLGLDVTPVVEDILESQSVNVLRPGVSEGESGIISGSGLTISQSHAAENVPVDSSYVDPSDCSGMVTVKGWVLHQVDEICISDSFDADVVGIKVDDVNETVASKPGVWGPLTGIHARFCANSGRAQRGSGTVHVVRRERDG